MNGEVPHLRPPPTPSSPLRHLAGPSLPPCWLQKTTPRRDTQFGEAFGAPRPCPGLPRMGSEMRKQLGAKCPIPIPPSRPRLNPPFSPSPMPGSWPPLPAPPPPPDLSPSWLGGTLRSYLLVHDGASQLLHMGQLRGGGQQHKLAGQPDLDVEGDPGARSWDLGQLRWWRLQLQAAGGRRRPRPGRAWEPGEMGRGGGHGGRGGGESRDPPPGAGRPAPTRDEAEGARGTRVTGSEGARKMVVGARESRGCEKRNLAD